MAQPASGEPFPFWRTVWAIVVGLWLYTLTAAIAGLLVFGIAVTFLGRDASDKLEDIGPSIDGSGVTDSDGDTSTAGNERYVACMRDPDTTAVECERFLNDE